ncbi:SH3-domain-containing protein [Dichomitus squalens LYAD-421 SS1]|uniref:SH3-domain-containing protein n=1 Tax=Dichomitus squalens (strain LYAD-421) TaxID=732165 RepID=R7SIZ2_DICSQ|nr:SH3-domain-containing protein [Dichomitus squalens LYAD-421 SS1]EJF55843.1 SH3-domain-containing protein [Dichomitus squalens LYAD-421 SS1]
MPVTTTPSDPQAAALLAHVLQQTQSNINFLASQNYISHAEASDLISRLTQGADHDSLLSSMNNLAVGPARAPPEPARRSIPPPPPRNHVQKARALWAYNEDGREPNDLSFSQGEIIEIVDETNADWWTGKVRGKQGLFPSNHVEKIPSGPSTSPAPPVSMPPMPSAPSYYAPPPPGPPQPYYQGPAPDYNNEKTSMYQPAYAPPAPVQAPQPPVQQVVVQQEPPKKSKFGKLGNTMATSAAGGVGFGAGAAIGSGIVNAIF